MIKTALIQNFQGHEKLRVDFDPHVTTIVGPSDVGKSAIIRLLRWVMQNTPQGTAFIREGAPGCTGKLYVDDHIITRKRARTGDNLYYLDDREFKAFGTNVPEPIAKLLNVSDVNFQGQHDASFWLSLSAGEVSRQLNSVVDLGIIDTALENINRKYRQATDQVENRRELLGQAKIQRDSLKWVDEAHKELEAVEGAAAQHAAVAVSVVQLRSAVRNARDRADYLQAATQRLEQLKKVGRTASQLLRVQTQREDVHRLVRAADRSRRIVQRGYPDLVQLTANYESWRLVQVDKKSLLSILKALRRGQSAVAKGTPDTGRLDSLYRTYSLVSGRANSLLYLIEQVKAQRADIEKFQRRLQSALTELQEKTEGRCPVCGQPMEVK